VGSYTVVTAGRKGRRHFVIPAGRRDRRQTLNVTEVDMSNPSEIPSARTEKALLIVFADLTRYMVNARDTPDATLAELLDGYYHRRRRR